MQFDILYEEILKQMQFDFNNTPKYNIKSWMDMVDINVKQKYFKIKNMKSNPKGQRIAFLKFWNQLIDLLNKKGISDPHKLESLGIPLYIINRNR